MWFWGTMWFCYHFGVSDWKMLLCSFVIASVMGIDIFDEKKCLGPEGPAPGTGTRQRFFCFISCDQSIWRPAGLPPSPFHFRQLFIMFIKFEVGKREAARPIQLLADTWLGSHSYKPYARLFKWVTLPETNHSTCQEAIPKGNYNSLLTIHHQLLC